MNLLNTKMELIAPVFLGWVSSLALCAMLFAFVTASVSFARGLLPAHAAAREASPLATAEEAPAPEPEEDAARFFAGTAGNRPDLIQEMYRRPDAQDWVIDFFAKLCKSREIAVVILANADAFDIAPALAFALSWEESRFNPQAVNGKNRDESIDRGLFQLNSRSFPRLETSAFFDPTVNAWHAMGHLRYCLETGGSEIAALAMYNAGTGRVRGAGTPKTTLDYVHRILENRRKIEARFAARSQVARITAPEDSFL